MITGKIIAVTGASRGLGREIAVQLVAQGAQVALIARKSGDLDALADELGDAALALPTDIGDVASVESSFAAIADRFGRLDVLFNNAAFYYPVDFEHSPPDRIAQHFNTNVLGASWCMRAALPLLRQAGGGDIVNVSSVSVRIAPPMMGVYAASKAALETLSTSLANELKNENIRVTLLRLGAIAGGTASAGWDPEITARFIDAIKSAPRVGGKPVSAQTLAGIAIDIIRLPREVRVNLIDASPAQ